MVNGDFLPDDNDGTYFGTVELVNLPRSGTFTLVNSGTAPLQISSVTIDFVAGCTGAFALSGASLDGRGLAPGETADMTINFVTDQNCLIESWASVTILSNDGSNSPYSFYVRAKGGYGALKYVGDTNFTVNMSAGPFTETKPIILTVEGNLDVTIMSGQLSASSFGTWAEQGMPSPGTTISPGQQITINVTFQPTGGPGNSYDAKLLFFTDKGDFEVLLYGIT
jgi:hypothetical protein